jgi:sulfate transport system permease protein
MEAGTLSQRNTPARAGIRLPGLGAGVGRGMVVLYLSILVLLPLAAMTDQSLSQGLGHFWEQVTLPQSVKSLELTLVASLIVVVINGFFGTILAWLLVRDEFPGKAVVNAVIDLPFALPTIVASLILIELWGAKSPFGIDISLSQTAVVVALLFVTLPFVVRAVQPLLIEMDREMEEAAASLGAGGLTVFRRIIFPNLLPGLAAGVALAFARALGEFGSVLLFAGGLPDTMVSSVYIKQLIENGNDTGAAAVSVVLLLASVLLLAIVSLAQRWGSRHERSQGAGLTTMPMSGDEPRLPKDDDDDRR